MVQILPALLLVFTVTLGESATVGVAPEWSPWLAPDGSPIARLGLGLSVTILVPVAYIALRLSRAPTPAGRIHSSHRYPFVVALASLFGLLEGSVFPFWESVIPGGWPSVPRALALTPSLVVLVWGLRRLRQANGRSVLEVPAGQSRMLSLILIAHLALTGLLDLGWYFPIWRVTALSHPLFLVGFLTGLVILLILAAPRFIQLLWPVTPLPPGELRQRLEAIGARAGVRWREILVWRTGPLGAVNACVAGVLPRIRRIFLTEGLLGQLPDEQIEAVFAHELSHAKRRHLWIYVGVVWVALTGLSGLEMWSARSHGSTWISLAILFGAFVVLLAWVGRLSRLLEHEADLVGATLTSTPVYANTLASLLGGAGPDDRRTWRHPSLARRLEAVLGLPASLGVITRRRRKALRRLALAAVVTTSLVGWQIAAHASRPGDEVEFERLHLVLEELAYRERRPGHEGAAHDRLRQEAVDGLRWAVDQLGEEHVDVRTEYERLLTGLLESSEARP